MEVDHPSWEVMIERLIRAAKQFKTIHPGRKMEVEVVLSRWHNEYKDKFVRWCTWGGMLELKEDANVVITN